MNFGGTRLRDTRLLCGVNGTTWWARGRSLKTRPWHDANGLGEKRPKRDNDTVHARTVSVKAIFVIRSSHT